MFDVRLLTYFVAVADECSFSRAAARLNIAQPWLSRQIRNLEQQLGFALFDRTTRRVALSERGALLLERARLAVENAEATLALARTLRSSAGRALKIGVAPYALFVEARTQLFDRFMREKPGAHLDVEIGRGEQTLKDLESGLIDAACVIADDKTLANKALVSMPLCSGGVDIVIPRHDPLSRRRHIRADDLRGRTIATFSQSANREMFDLVFGALAQAGAKIAEFSDYSFFSKLAERGHVTALPAWQPAPIGAVARRPFAERHRTISLHLIRHGAHRLPLLDEFWRLAEAANAPARH